MNSAAETSHLGTAESPPLAELVGRLSEDLKLLTRQEAQLAKSELTETLNEAKRRAAQLALGGSALVAGLLTLIAAAVLALATIMAAWSAALLVGGSLSLLGAMLLVVAKASLSRVTLKPQQTIDSVEKDITAIKKAAQ
jgi:predicted phage tail protein